MKERERRVNITRECERERETERGETEGASDDLERDK